MGTISSSPPTGTLDKLQAAKKNTTFFTTPIGVGRKILAGAASLKETFSPGGPEKLSANLNYIGSVLKPLALIGAFFNLVTLVTNGKAIKKSVERQDKQAVAVGVLAEVEETAGFVEKMITATKGVVETIQGAAKVIPIAAASSVFSAVQVPAAVSQTLSVAGQFVRPLNALVNGIGLVTNSIGLFNIHKVSSKVKEIQKAVEDPSNVKSGKLLQLVDEAIGLTEGETKELKQKARAIWDKQIAKGKRLTEEDSKKMLNDLKARKIQVKQARFESATSKEALAMMQQLRVGLAYKKELNDDKVKLLFSNMRTLLHRRIAIKSLRLVNSLVGLTCLGLLYTPIAPFGPIFALAANQIFGFTLTMIDRFKLEKGLPGLDNPKELIKPQPPNIE